MKLLQCLDLTHHNNKRHAMKFVLTSW